MNVNNSLIINVDLQNQRIEAENTDSSSSQSVANGFQRESEPFAIIPTGPQSRSDIFRHAENSPFTWIYPKDYVDPQNQHLVGAGNTDSNRSQRSIQSAASAFQRVCEPFLVPERNVRMIGHVDASPFKWVTSDGIEQNSEGSQPSEEGDGTPDANDSDPAKIGESDVAAGPSKKESTTTDHRNLFPKKRNRPSLFMQNGGTTIDMDNRRLETLPPRIYQGGYEGREDKYEIIKSIQALQIKCRVYYILFYHLQKEGPFEIALTRGERWYSRIKRRRTPYSTQNVQTVRPRRRRPIIPRVAGGYIQNGQLVGFSKNGRHQFSIDTIFFTKDDALLSMNMNTPAQQSSPANTKSGKSMKQGAMLQAKAATSSTNGGLSEIPDNVLSPWSDMSQHNEYSVECPESPTLHVNDHVHYRTENGSKAQGVIIGLVGNMATVQAEGRSLEIETDQLTKVRE